MLQGGEKYLRLNGSHPHGVALVRDRVDTVNALAGPRINTTRTERKFIQYLSNFIPPPSEPQASLSLSFNADAESGTFEKQKKKESGDDTRNSELRHEEIGMHRSGKTRSVFFFLFLDERAARYEMDQFGRVSFKSNR